MKIKCTETFEYILELPDGLNDTQINNSIWKIRDSIDCVNDMTCPFWDGYPEAEEMSETFKYEKI